MAPHSSGAERAAVFSTAIHSADQALWHSETTQEECVNTLLASPSTVQNRRTSMRPTPDALPVLPAVDSSVSLAWCSHTSLDLPGLVPRARSWRTFRELEVPSIEKVPDEHPHGSPPRRPSSAGRRMGDPHVFIDVREPRLDPSARRSSRLLQGRMRFHDFCRGCFNEHGEEPPEHPNTRIRMLGRLHVRSIVTFRSKGNHRGYAGSGVEDHRTSTFPFEIAPKRDFAPTPIASDSSCRKDRLSTLSGTTRIKNELANAVLLARRRAARGP